MRVNTIVTLGASAAFGVLAIFLSRGWINDAVTDQYTGQQTNQQQQFTQTSAKTKTVPVLVADSPVNFGDHLSQQNIRVVQYPESAVPEGSYSTYGQLFTDPNSSIVALTKIAVNEPILGFKVSGPDGRGTLSAVINENMRGVSIRVNDVAGVGGFVMPGDYVDVVLTRDAQQTRRNGTDLTSSLLLENVRVLGADQNLDDQSVEADIVKTVTLEVTPQQAQKLILAMDIGKLSLTLRRAGEMNSIPTQKVSARDLDSTSRAGPQPQRRPRVARVTAPKPAANSTASVVITRNGSSEQISVFKETKKPDEELAGGEL